TERDCARRIHSCDYGSRIKTDPASLVLAPAPVRTHMDATSFSRAALRSAFAHTKTNSAIAAARQCRAPNSAPVKATRHAGGEDAGLDRRCRRARAYASAPGGMQPVSHQGGMDRYGMLVLCPRKFSKRCS